MGPFIYCILSSVTLPLFAPFVYVLPSYTIYCLPTVSDPAYTCNDANVVCNSGVHISSIVSSVVCHLSNMFLTICRCHYWTCHWDPNLLCSVCIGYGGCCVHFQKKGYPGYVHMCLYACLVKLKCMHVPRHCLLVCRHQRYSIRKT